MTAPGFYDNVPEAEYHADKSSLSASSAKVLLGHRPPSSDSPAIRFGTLVHLVILEPHRINELVPLDADVIGVKSDGTPAQSPTMTAAWKKAVAEVEASGKKVVAKAELDQALAMRDAVHAHPDARHILNNCPHREISAYAEHPSGAFVRGRYDAHGGRYLADLKSTDDASPEKFAKKAADFGYHISAANYIDIGAANGHDFTGLAFINVEREPTPNGAHRVSVTEIDVSGIELGRDLMAEACRRWLDNGQTVDLPQHQGGVNVVALPDWAYRQRPIHHLELQEPA